MENSATQKVQVLITDVGNYLGHQLAKSLLSSGAQVFGLAKSHTQEELLGQKDFTLLELDLAQPLPAHLPKFDLAFFISHDQSPFTPGLSAMPHFSTALSNILTLSHLNQIKVILTLPITTDPEIYDYLAKTEEERQKLTVFLLGDVYGPGLDLKSSEKLANLISQAVYSNKVILENEGLDTIYPAYISDIISALAKFATSESYDSRKVHIVSGGPMTTLSVGYEIQKAARLILGKEVDLFFAGLGPSSPTPQQIIKSYDQSFLPIVGLAEGLAQTFDYFAKEKRPALHHFVHHPPSQPVQVAPEKPRGILKDITAKIPHHGIKRTSKPNRKKIGMVLGAIILLFIAKTGLDVFLGISRLESAGSAIASGDFKKAQNSSAAAAGSFKNARGEIGLILSPFSLIFPQKTQSIDLTFDAIENSSTALSHLAEGASQLGMNLSIVSQKDARPPTTDAPPDFELTKSSRAGVGNVGQVKADGLDLESPQVDFRSAFFASSRAQELAKKAKAASPFPSKIEAIRQAAADLNSVSQSAFDLSNLIVDLVGQAGPKSYLLLLENNTELRPGGGFIGNIGTIDFEAGRLKNISVDDVYNVDGQLKEKITPPVQIKEKLGADRFYLRDSGWSPDFQLNSQIARDFFKKETGKNVDGVISLDLTFMQKILGKTGPVKLSDFNEEISAANLFERGEYYSEVGFFPGSTQKRDFFGALARTLINRTLSSLNAKDQTKDKISMLSLIEVFKEGLAQKHVMFTFDSPGLAAYVRTHGWNRPIPPATFNPGDDTGQTRDFLALSEANLGANKANRFIDRKISYEMTIGRDADLVANLKIIYTNNSQADTWPAGKYVNFLRVYTPGLITLLSVNGSDKIDPKAVQVSTLGNLSSISTYVEVPIKSTKEITFSYRLPKSIKLETAPVYNLYVQKQPGTLEDPFEFKFNLPGYLVTKSVNGQDQNTQNLNIKTNLLVDREFKVEVAKK
ncbi:MAG: DUF4012 domain-containing protein [Candidatus Curtissbacteria bacterium]|nr:DUF4012 domain-containing protein [Candidatus Curtissbacteria bacterium]